MAATDFIDACQVCQPGDAPAAPPLGPAEEANGGEVTDHQCSVCKTAWSTFWREGWAIDRLIAPVSQDSAVEHRREAAGRRAA